jgi:alkylation response protein AidB-like acyl-CoA dehydrogenase
MCESRSLASRARKASVAPSASRNGERVDRQDRDARATYARVDERRTHRRHRRRKVSDYSLESATQGLRLGDAVVRRQRTAPDAAGIGYMQDYPSERMMRDARST